MRKRFPKYQLNSRNMEYRYQLVFQDRSFQGETILDLGCNHGLFCQEVVKRGASQAVGVDIDPRVIPSLQENPLITLKTLDLNAGLKKAFEVIGTEKFDHVFAFSILRYIKKPILLDLLSYYTRKSCWLEFHNKGKPRKLIKELTETLKCDRVNFLGKSTDNGTRPLFRLDLKGGSPIAAISPFRESR